MTPSDRILLSLLSNNDVTFFIPPFQRNYEWTNEQCDVFWRDIDVTARRNLAGERSEHFFGTVTYYQTDSTFGEPNILVLVDGQQRITTTMLFLAALRDTCGDAKKANLIDNKYLKNQNSSGEKDEFKVKLKQVETDWPAYKKLILAEPLSEVERVSAVYSNYHFFKEAISLRANRMIGLLVNSILPIPDEMRTANNYNVRKQVKSKSLSFEEMGLIGEEITFVDDSDIVAKVVGDTEVEFEGKRMKLSPLTREIKIRQGRCNKSGAYQGAQYWKYEDTRLAELM